jgi:hypothetical protein
MQGDLVEIIGEAPLGALPQQSSQALPERLRHGFRLRLARELGQRFSQLFGPGISDAQSHAIPASQRNLLYLSTITQNSPTSIA